VKRLSDGFDQFGNPAGRAFDLGGGDEERVRGERILFYVALTGGNFAESELRQIMAERGLRLDVRHAPGNGRCDLSDSVLAGYTQLWYVSGDRPTLSGAQVKMIADYVRRGNGLAIWADNDPYYADANLLAHALLGSRFSGNEPGDQVMVPGAAQTPGRFVEHQLTQGVNNLYEGITICTIDPKPGLVILGRSHDGQMCLGCFERDSQRVVLDTGFTKLYREYFHKSAGLGRYLSNIAFWLARGSRGVEYTLLTPGNKKIETIGKGETSKGYQFKVTKPTAVTCILQWDGKATMELLVRGPDGAVARQESATSGPMRVGFPARTSGNWVAEVKGIDMPSAEVPYVLTLSYESAPEKGSAPTKSSAPAKAEGRIIMPFYLVCDVSASARSAVGELNAALRDIQRNLGKDPRMGDVVSLSVIAFNDTAATVVPLAAPSDITAPTLRASGARSYGAAFREFQRAFEQDRTRLKAEGARVFRPCVFFLTHGEPAGPDQAGAFRSFLGYDPATQRGNRAYPTVVAFGFPGTSRRALAELAYPDFGDENKRGRWLLASSTAEAFRAMTETICRTVTATYATASRGAPAFVPPPSIPGTLGGIAGQDSR
jgi:uncharacterized protein YegL